jgi:hypothetical protein
MRMIDCPHWLRGSKKSMIAQHNNLRKLANVGFQRRIYVVEGSGKISWR